MAATFGARKHGMSRPRPKVTLRGTFATADRAIAILKQLQDQYASFSAEQMDATTAEALSEDMLGPQATVLDGWRAARHDGNERRRCRTRLACGAACSRQSKYTA